jgi:hypothetical protein
MKTVNSLSGGKTSSYMAVKYPADHELFSLVCIDDIKSKPKDDYIIKYVNHKLEKYAAEYGEFIATAEDDKTLRVMIDLEQHIGKNIEWVRGMSFDDVIDKGTQTILPSWMRRYCTEKMKLLPIFLWWFNNIGVKCEMRIGFRFDEFDRMIRFFNNSDPVNFKIPVACKNYGTKQQTHTNFNWRNVAFPLVKDAITKEKVYDYWDKTMVGGTLFEEYHLIDFPAISNCIGCFHKNEATLAVMADINLEKISWFAKQELKGMGTWLDNKVTYQSLIDNKENVKGYSLAKFEITKLNQTCDTGGCTD